MQYGDFLDSWSNTTTYTSGCVPKSEQPLVTKPSALIPGWMAKTRLQDLDSINCSRINFTSM